MYSTTLIVNIKFAIKFRSNLSILETTNGPNSTARGQKMSKLFKLLVIDEKQSQIELNNFDTGNSLRDIHSSPAFLQETPISFYVGTRPRRFFSFFPRYRIASCN